MANARKKSRGPRTTRTPFRRTLEEAKQKSTLQLLFKAARLLDEEGVRRVAERRGAPRLRRSHMALFPHIDLEGTRMSVLVERLGISKQAVSELVGDLEELGVVERTLDPLDRRARLVSFTAKGQKAMLEGIGLLRDMQNELAAAVGIKTMSALHEALVSILEHLERSREAD